MYILVNGVENCVRMYFVRGICTCEGSPKSNGSIFCFFQQSAKGSCVTRITDLVYVLYHLCHTFSGFGAICCD